MINKISLLHPSRGRSKQAVDAAMNWSNKRSGGVDIEYILSLDTSDPLLNQYDSTAPYVIINNNRSIVDACNVAALKSTGDLLIVMSDDFDCPQDWDMLLIEALKGKEDFVVKTKDGQQDWIITLPLMDRTYYNRFGYLYNPIYTHMFCDTEMTAVGDLLDKTITLDLTFEHIHYTTGKVAKDATYARSDRTWESGMSTYLQRVKENFGLKPEDIKGKIKDAEHLKWIKANTR